MKRAVLILVAALAAVAWAAAQDKPAEAPASTKIPAGAKLFIAPMDDGFDTYMKGALIAKKVPVVVVDKKEDAEFEMTGHSETQKASTAKKVIMWDWHSNEQASVQVAELTSGTVAWAYSVNKTSSARGKRSTAEACAKHLKEKIEKGK